MRQRGEIGLSSEVARHDRPKGARARSPRLAAAPWAAAGQALPDFTHEHAPLSRGHLRGGKQHMPSGSRTTARVSGAMSKAHRLDDPKAHRLDGTEHERYTSRERGVAVPAQEEGLAHSGDAARTGLTLWYLCDWNISRSPHSNVWLSMVSSSPTV